MGPIYLVIQTRRMFIFCDSFSPYSLDSNHRRIFRLFFETINFDTFQFTQLRLAFCADVAGSFC